MDTQPKPRTLKVQGLRDYKKRVKSQLLLSGYWLEDAGLTPNSKVIIFNPRPGTLTIERINPDEK